MSLNGGQTETIIFKNNQQTITKHLNFRVSGHKIHPKNTVKYLDVYLNDFLTWDTHLTVLLPQLNWAVGLLSKICDYTPKFLLKTICYLFFIFHLIYAWPIRGKTKTNLFTKIEKLHDKALPIIDFLPKGNPMNDIYENSKILNLQDYISLQNALLVKDCFATKTSQTNTQHEHSAHSALKNCVLAGNVCTDTYGKNSVKYQFTKIWNELQRNLNLDLLDQSKTKGKNLIIEYFLKSVHNNQ